MAYLLIALLFVATYLFFETINLIVGNKENIKQKFLSECGNCKQKIGQIKSKLPLSINFVFSWLTIIQCYFL